MTKRWSSVRSDLVSTKREASKRARKWKPEWDLSADGSRLIDWNSSLDGCGQCHEYTGECQNCHGRGRERKPT